MKIRSRRSRSATGEAATTSMADAAARPHCARKRFGQHFLEPAWADKLVTAIAPASDDVFLEIGPGRGILTRRLAAKAAHVVGVELDRDLAAALREEPIANLEILDGDFLKVPEGELRRAVERPGQPARLRVA